MKNFEYEHYTVDIQEPTGRITMYFKGKDKVSVVKQINRYVAKSNSPENMAKPLVSRYAPVSEVFWDTLTLIRTGHNR